MRFAGLLLTKDQARLYPIVIQMESLTDMMGNRHKYY